MTQDNNHQTNNVTDVVNNEQNLPKPMQLQQTVERSSVPQVTGTKTQTLSQVIPLDIPDNPSFSLQAYQETARADKAIKIRRSYKRR